MLSYLNPVPTLPDYPGPYRVGTTEYEIPVSEISSESAVPDTSITTVKFRIFYPTTHDATSSTTLYWLPTPQNKWNEAYASFMGASPRLSSIVSSLPSFLNYIKLPAVHNAPLHPSGQDSRFPLAIFSHGLGGNYNTYSSITGALASCGVVCVAPEHRDGSAPISLIQNADGDIVKEVEYSKLSHAPSAEVLNARNAQLRIRLWELELIYSTVSKMNDGKAFSNYVKSKDATTEKFKGKLNTASGKVTWAGHSFGAATITQFVKSIYYREHFPLPDPKAEQQEWDWTPLYKPVGNCQISQQITSESPVALLDLWTMPLRSETTKWLWQKPLPCYERTSNLADDRDRPNVVAIMSAEFYKWTDLLNRTRAVLSRSPVDAIQVLGQMKERDDQNLPVGQPMPSLPIPEISKQDPSPAHSTTSSRSSTPPNDSDASSLPSPASSQSSLPLSGTELLKDSSSNASQPHLYLVPQSAHLSQSDFGPLFPTLTRYVMKAIEPEKTIELNIRAIIAMMQGCGLSVKSMVEGTDPILDDQGLGKGQRWQRVPPIHV